MALSADGGLAVTPRTIDVAQPEQTNVLADMLRRLATSGGQTYGALVKDFVRTSFGPGKLSFDEYVAFALYDTARCAGVDKRSFAGRRVMERIWQEANYREDQSGLVANKIAMTALLDAHGIPVIPIKALFSSVAGFASEKSFHTRQALADFLSDAANYPMFAKPMDGFQSLGSASLARYDASGGSLIDHTGRATALDAYVDEIAAHYGSGYIFQPRVVPHAQTAAICGDRLATVRVLTALTADGPKVLRACEKIPAGANAADNYWRAGNLLVQLDRATGKRGRAISGKGLDLKEHTHHPDSAAPIAGTTVPNWPRVCELALEGARLLKDVGLIGWDIAPVDDGAVIVESNVTPDLVLPQLADCRGILDDELAGFLAERRQSKLAWVRQLRADGQKHRRASWT